MIKEAIVKIVNKGDRRCGVEVEPGASRAEKGKSMLGSVVRGD